MLAVIKRYFKRCYEVKMKFLESENVIPCLLAKYCRDGVFALADRYHISSHDVISLSANFIRNRFRTYFSGLM